MYFNVYYTCLVLLMELDYLIASLTDLNQLSYYEVIELRHKDSRGRSRRDLSTYSRERKIHFQDSNFHFSGHGRQFNLKIYKNEFLLPTTYRRIHQNKNGGYNFDNKVEHCYYHGYLANKTSSSAVVSTCLGLKGVIRDEDEEEFHIEPHPTDVKLNFNVHDNRARYILYKSKDILNIEDDGIKLCGVNDSNILDNSGVNFLHFQEDSKYSSHSNSNHNGSHERYRRSSTKINLKYIEVIVVIDNLKFKSHGENITAAEHRALEVSNMVDHVYKTMDTRVPVVNVVIWNIYNMASVTPTPGETLNSFERYTKDVLREELSLSFDNAQLLTTQRWGNLVGLAGIGVMCGLMSSAINRDYHSNAAITANTVAHEMGHNLGFMHYDSKKCVCDKGPCVMSSVAPFSPCKSFTECSTRVYDNKFVDGRLPCLLDYPGNLFGDPKCGNGYLEEGEECDCGTEEDCRKLNLDKCCHHTTCKLRVNAQCATGACCENCKFKRRGILCRGKSNIDCDLEEFCTGRSAYCPKNFHLQDGSPCNDDTAYCYQGTCSTHDAQCEELWGPNAKKAPNQCYELNRGETGSIWANCGKNDRGDYVGCSKDDILCGKLQCQAKSRNKPLPMFPIIGSRRGRNIVTLNDGTTCVLGKTLTSDLQDPSLTEDGMKCANNSICIEHKCQKLSTLTYIKNCSKTCMLNGGVCNNNGNCHCPKGKACPYCELAGPGGSADSGQGCILHDNCEDCFSALTKTLFIIFFLVIPVIILIVAIRYRVKLREKFMQKKQNSRREETEKRQSRRGQWSAQEMSVTVGDDTTNVNHVTPSRRPPVPPPPIVITPAKT